MSHIVCGILTDGRAELFEQTVKSARENLYGVDFWFVVNDSGDPNYHIWAKRLAPDMHHVNHPVRRGLAGAVQSVWDQALGTDCDYLFHLEGDFTILTPIDVGELACLLGSHPHLAQLVLQRQALSPAEVEAGGVAAHAHWVEAPGFVQQTDIFSLNPCLIPRHVLEYGWPEGPLGVGNETGMTNRLREDGYWFAFYGTKTSSPQVEHTGSYRSDGWKL